jgi:hypothetical protein
MVAHGQQSLLAALYTRRRPESHLEAVCGLSGIHDLYPYPSAAILLNRPVCASSGIVGRDPKQPPDRATPGRDICLTSGVPERCL